jgi:hypothetical protein
MKMMFAVASNEKGSLALISLGFSGSYLLFLPSLQAAFGVA